MYKRWNRANLKLEEARCFLTMQFRHKCPWKRSSASRAKKKGQILSSPSSVLSGADENWQRSFREGRQWARIVKTSLPNHGGREQRQSPPLLRGHKLIRRRKERPKCSLLVMRRADCRSEVAREQRARILYPCVERRPTQADRSCFESNLIRINLIHVYANCKSYFIKLKDTVERDILKKELHITFTLMSFRWKIL